MNEPNLQHFEVFLQVAKKRSITQAAHELGLSKAAVSQTIKQFETRLEAPLFYRTTRQMSLTELGQQLFEQCQQLKNELDQARDLITGFKKSPSGTLRISSNPYFAKQCLISILAKYQQKFPQVEVELFAEERMPDLNNERIDIVFGINWPAPDEVVARPIAKTRYVLCASPQYLKQKGTPTSLDDLAEHDFIRHLGRQQLLIDNKRKTYPSPKCRMAINNAELIKQYALADLGLIQLHDYMVKSELDNGELQEVLNHEFQQQIDIFVYYQKQRYVQPKIRHFIDLLFA